jgi:hypothetical protein
LILFLIFVESLRFSEGKQRLSKGELRAEKALTHPRAGGSRGGGGAISGAPARGVEERDVTPLPLLHPLPPSRRCACKWPSLARPCCALGRRSSPPNDGREGAPGPDECGLVRGADCGRWAERGGRAEAGPVRGVVWADGRCQLVALVVGW